MLFLYLKDERLSSFNWGLIAFNVGESIVFSLRITVSFSTCLVSFVRYDDKMVCVFFAWRISFKFELYSFASRMIEFAKKNVNYARKIIKLLNLAKIC